MDDTDGGSSESGVTLDDTDNKIPGTNEVSPGYVDDYTRSDGTAVSGYYRDGDGDPDTQLTVEQGGGYEQSNPDETPNNNIKF
ncbi:hypothetical protein [Peribacillus sp. NPDC060253]|uniref:hypothetical protein n=1 Tax=Peribacillus sp. NPDC060253 TaxID=3347084 RepID=UPI0036683736